MYLVVFSSVKGDFCKISANYYNTILEGDRANGIDPYPLAVATIQTVLKDKNPLLVQREIQLVDCNIELYTLYTP
jgi:hypothetical protein